MDRERSEGGEEARQSSNRTGEAEGASVSNIHIKVNAVVWRDPWCAGDYMSTRRRGRAATAWAWPSAKMPPIAMLPLKP